MLELGLQDGELITQRFVLFGVENGIELVL
jgi:hypothetical protein